MASGPGHKGLPRTEDQLTQETQGKPSDLAIPGCLTGSLPGSYLRASVCGVCVCLYARMYVGTSSPQMADKTPSSLSSSGFKGHRLYLVLRGGLLEFQVAFWSSKWKARSVCPAPLTCWESNSKLFLCCPGWQPKQSAQASHLKHLLLFAGLLG